MDKQAQEILSQMVDAKVTAEYIEKTAGDASKAVNMFNAAKNKVKNFAEVQKMFVIVPTVTGAVKGAIDGAFDDRKDRDGKAHRVKKSLKKATSGAAKGFGGGLASSLLYYNLDRDGQHQKRASEVLDEMRLEKQAGLPVVSDRIYADYKALPLNFKDKMQNATYGVRNAVKHAAKGAGRVAAKHPVSTAMAAAIAANQGHKAYKDLKLSKKGKAAYVDEKMKDATNYYNMHNGVRGFRNSIESHRGFQQARPDLDAKLKRVLDGEVTSKAEARAINKEYNVGHREYFLNHERERFSREYDKRYGSKKTAAELLDEICLEKEAGYRYWSDERLQDKINKLQKKNAKGYMGSMAKGALISAGVDAGIYAGVLGVDKALTGGMTTDTLKALVGKKQMAKASGTNLAKGAAVGAAIGAGTHAYREHKLKKLHNEYLRRNGDIEDKTASLSDLDMEKEAFNLSTIKNIGTKVMPAVKNTAGKALNFTANSLDKAKPGLGSSVASVAKDVAKTSGNFLKSNGKVMGVGAGIGAGIGAIGGAIKGAPDENGNKHRIKGMLGGAVKGAVGGATVGGIAGGVIDNTKTALELLDEMCMEKEAGAMTPLMAGGTGIASAVRGATKGYTKGGIGGAIAGGLSAGAKGVVAGATVGGIVDGITAKQDQNHQQQMQ